VFAVLLALPGALPAGCPLTGPQAFAALAVTCLALFPLIGLVKLIAGHACALLSRTALAHLGDPVAKVKTRNKLRDQSWQLTIHSAMTALEAYILFVDGGGEHWLDDYRSLWTPHPHQQVNSKRSVHLLYLLQMAIWIVTCASHRFLEERHKDYVMMYVHHLVTIALFALSYGFNFVRIGTAVIFLHDSSDIVIDLLKMANYLKLEGRRGGFLVRETGAMRGDAGRCGEMRGDLELEGRRGGLLYLSSHLPPASPHTSALEARGGPVQPDGRSREDAASAALRCTRSARTRDTCTHSRTPVPPHKSAQPQARTRRSRRSPFTRRDVYSHKHSAPRPKVTHARAAESGQRPPPTPPSAPRKVGAPPPPEITRDRPRSPEIARDRPRSPA